MPNFVEISSPVSAKKILEGFLPCLGIAVILVMRPGLFLYPLVPPSYIDTSYNIWLLLAKQFPRIRSLNFMERVYMHIAPGMAGQLMFNFFFININLSIFTLPASFSHLITVYLFSPFNDIVDPSLTLP